jgi:hypothetical protein
VVYAHFNTFVIPAQAGIQSGEWIARCTAASWYGRFPKWAGKVFGRKAKARKLAVNDSFCPLRGVFELLDSRLRGNDGAGIIRASPVR